MPFRFLFRLILMLVSLQTPALSQAPLHLVHKGKSPYRILLSASATETEIRAASILQQYLLKITGAELPVLQRKTAGEIPEEILIGKIGEKSFDLVNNQGARLSADGFCIKTLEKKLVIAGGSGKGVIYGVTDLLENKLGCRKFAPDVEHVPTAKDIILPAMDERQEPPADIRVVNGNFANDEDYKDWRKLNTIADKWSGPKFQGYYVHTFNRFVPSKEYFDEHPEYFSLVNGKRIPYGQLCLSNPDVFALTVAKLRAEMALHPEVQYWSVSQNDTYGNCQCEACKKLDEPDGGPIGSLLQFVNRVAAEFPDKTITTLAYQYTRKPPLKTKPAPNVMITLCTIELNRSIPIADDPGSLSFKNDIIGWSKICNNIMLWDYEVQFTNYLCPFPLFHTLQPNIQFFNQYGVKAHFQQCNAVHGVEFAELKTYLLSKLLWDPNADANAIIDDFMRGYYKDAAPFIRKYFDLLHAEARKSGQGLDIYGSPVWHANTFLSAENIARYYAIFEEAEAAVKDQPDILESVKTDRLCVQYADMEIAKTDMFGPRGWYTLQDGKYRLKPERKQLLEDFYATCKRNHVVQLNENGLTADIFYNNTLRFIDVQVEGNLAFAKKATCTPLPSPKYAGSGPNPLTNGVKGTDDYKINWLGWEGKDLEILIDLEHETSLKEITLSTLQFPKSWITHPLKVTCLLSREGSLFMETGSVASKEDLREETQMKNFTFSTQGKSARYVKLLVTGTKILPDWHDYRGNPSWVFIDEVVIR